MQGYLVLALMGLGLAWACLRASLRALIRSLARLPSAARRSPHT